MLSHSYVVCYAQRHATSRSWIRATVQYSDPLPALHCIAAKGAANFKCTLKLFSFSPLDLDRAGGRNIFF